MWRALALAMLGAAGCGESARAPDASVGDLAPPDLADPSCPPECNADFRGSCQTEGGTCRCFEAGFVCEMGTWVCTAGVCCPGYRAGTGDACDHYPCTPVCPGSDAKCLTTDENGNAWPGGYCTSRCDPSLNDPRTGWNPTCSSGRSVCVGTGTVGRCELGCGDASPCTRPGYSCIAGSCEPSALARPDLGGATDGEASD